MQSPLCESLAKWAVQNAPLLPEGQRLTEDGQQGAKCAASLYGGQYQDRHFRDMAVSSAPDLSGNAPGLRSVTDWQAGLVKDDWISP